MWNKSNPQPPPMNRRLSIPISSVTSARTPFLEFDTNVPLAAITISARNVRRKISMKVRIRCSKSCNLLWLHPPTVIPGLEDVLDLDPPGEGIATKVPISGSKAIGNSRRLQQIRLHLLPMMMQHLGGAGQSGIPPRRLCLQIRTTTGIRGLHRVGVQVRHRGQRFQHLLLPTYGLHRTRFDIWHDLYAMSLSRTVRP